MLKENAQLLSILIMKNMLAHVASVESGTAVLFKRQPLSCDGNVKTATRRNWNCVIRSPRVW